MQRTGRSESFNVTFRKVTGNMIGRWDEIDVRGD